MSTEATSRPRPKIGVRELTIEEARPRPERLGPARGATIGEPVKPQSIFKRRGKAVNAVREAVKVLDRDLGNLLATRSFEGLGRTVESYATLAEAIEELIESYKPPAVPKGTAPNPRGGGR